jgi:transmembrane protein 107
MEDSKHILVPAKFISIIMHLVATTMLYFSYKDNVISAYPALSTTSDSLYSGGKTSFMAANTLTIIGLAIEMIILFVGVNLFKERLSFIVATIHYLGCIIYISYGYGQWQFSSIWPLWLVFSLVPVMIEIIAACHPSNK